MSAGANLHVFQLEETLAAKRKMHLWQTVSSALLTLRPRSYLRALDDSPAAFAFCKAVLYMAILSSKVRWRLPGAAEDTFTSCFWTKRNTIDTVLKFNLLGCF